MRICRANAIDIFHVECNEIDEFILNNRPFTERIKKNHEILKEAGKVGRLNYENKVASGKFAFLTWEIAYAYYDLKYAK